MCILEHIPLADSRGMGVVAGKILEKGASGQFGARSRGSTAGGGWYERTQYVCSRTPLFSVGASRAGRQADTPSPRQRTNHAAYRDYSLPRCAEGWRTRGPARWAERSLGLWHAVRCAAWLCGHILSKYRQGVRDRPPAVENNHRTSETRDTAESAPPTGAGRRGYGGRTCPRGNQLASRRRHRQRA